MKLLIVGSRTVEKFDLSKYISSDTDLIISGGAKGIDSIAEKENRPIKVIILESK